MKYLLSRNIFSNLAMNSKRLFVMDIILFCLAVWWMGGILGFRKRKPKRRRKSSFWKPSLNEYDYEEHLRRNGK